MGVTCLLNRSRQAMLGWASCRRCRRCSCRFGEGARRRRKQRRYGYVHAAVQKKFVSRVCCRFRYSCRLLLLLVWWCWHFCWRGWCWRVGVRLSTAGTKLSCVWSTCASLRAAARPGSPGGASFSPPPATPQALQPSCWYLQTVRKMMRLSPCLPPHLCKVAARNECSEAEIWHNRRNSHVARE